MEEDIRNDMSPAEMDPNSMLDNIEEGMDVITRDGGNLGKVARVYRPVGVDEMDSMTHDAYIQVSDRGLFGLADDLYVPTSVLHSVERDRIILDVAKDNVPDMTWDRPYTLPDTAE